MEETLANQEQQAKTRTESADFWDEAVSARRRKLALTATHPLRLAMAELTQDQQGTFDALQGMGFDPVLSRRAALVRFPLSLSSVISPSPSTLTTSARPAEVWRKRRVGHQLGS